MNIKKMIKTAVPVIVIILFGYLVYDNCYLVFNKIEYVYKKYFQLTTKQNLVDNEYKKNENYEYVKINNDPKIKNKEELKNAIYTYLDAGWDTYVIKCDSKYLDCTNDVKEIVENKEELTSISNFVHPFNTFEEFNTSISSIGRVTLKRKVRYTDSQRRILNNKVNEIYNNNYDSSKSIKENIKIFHDYIINNSKYDANNTSGLSSLSSSSAYGVLIEGLGICSGYSDAMSLFLDKMNVRNYRISSNTHIWNFVYVDGEWKHLDLTWDDPVSYDGEDNLLEDYFLISTEELEKKQSTEHIFDKNIYLEAK